MPMYNITDEGTPQFINIQGQNIALSDIHTFKWDYTVNWSKEKESYQSNPALIIERYSWEDSTQSFEGLDAWLAYEWLSKNLVVKSFNDYSSEELDKSKPLVVVKQDHDYEFNPDTGVCYYPCTNQGKYNFWGYYQSFEDALNRANKLNEVAGFAPLKLNAEAEHEPLQADEEDDNPHACPECNGTMHEVQGFNYDEPPYWQCDSCNYID